MKFAVLAPDYNGTVAVDGVLDPSVRQAITELRQQGIAVVRVTGRRLADLRRVAGDLTCFDAVVGENGAVLELPVTGQRLVMAQPGWPSRCNSSSALRAPSMTWKLQLGCDCLPVHSECVRAAAAPIAGLPFASPRGPRRAGKTNRSRRQGTRTMRTIFCVAMLMVVLAAVPKATQSSTHQGHGGHQGMSMPMDVEAMTLTSQAKLLADKKESEFNHHLAGFFVALGAVFMLFQDRLTTRWPAVKYVWPACFLLSGIFVLVWSDIELWPFGSQPWLDTMAHDSEVFQHKTFAVLLLGLGVIEWQRVRGALTAAWSAWVFPVLALGGSVLLLFHQHGGGMHGPNHMERMARIQSEHLSYSLAGIGLALTRSLAEIETNWQKVLSRSWPVLMMVLGILLTFYRE
jgi:hypothetical protein